MVWTKGNESEMVFPIIYHEESLDRTSYLTSELSFSALKLLAYQPRRNTAASTHSHAVAQIASQTLTKVDTLQLLARIFKRTRVTCLLLIGRELYSAGQIPRVTSWALEFLSARARARAAAKTGSFTLMSRATARVNEHLNFCPHVLAHALQGKQGLLLLCREQQPE